MPRTFWYKYSVMVKIKKIAIVSTNSFGYIDFMVEKLNCAESVDLTYINIDTVPFEYKNNWERVQNCITKLLFKKGLKDANRTNFIESQIAQTDLFDQILIIRPDKLEVEALEILRANSLRMSCYLFDGIENFPSQKSVLGYFDTVFSYDKNDVEKYGFEFITNYIYDDEIEKCTTEHSVFNISSYDKRFKFLEQLSGYFVECDVSSCIIVKKDKAFKHKKIQFSKNYISLDEVKLLIAKSNVLIDIQKDNQVGLSFRVFEALGFRKKLITNNHDVANYDFYDKNNIHIISEDKFEIPKSFFETEYTEIDSEILKKYKLESCIFQVFNVECN